LELRKLLAIYVKDEEVFARHIKSFHLACEVQEIAKLTEVLLSHYLLEDLLVLDSLRDRLKEALIVI